MPVRSEMFDGVAVLTLDRPDVLNAFDDEFGNEFLAALAAAADDPSARCIAITGAGRAFSSGEDLGALQDAYGSGDPPELGRTLVDRYNPTIRAIRAAQKPVVAAVNGVAAGAGAAIALACDFRIASEHAKLVLAFVKVGLVPDSGALWFLTRMIGTARTWQLAASGDPLPADEALRLGVFDAVHPADHFESSWRDFAAGLARGPTRAFALTKSLLHAASESSLEAQLDREVDAQTEAGRTDDHLEGVRAFFERRAPSFGGR